ncbi:MAG: N-acetyl-alpha-D-glucosaminyl L-malate synthase BshA [Saprospiraceae bacterium]|nr:N-acetyl-alpha-D-glucosaminyl L-malate synthase BshA [Candidatus Opimibacter skivensis]MBP6679658.1 N-acetyl-alpha-D-glucosaminyl L-malate synthase BshA [Saprospiraceae bacterium]
MRIGIVCYPTYGGSGVVATELGLALAAKGHQIHFITYKRPVRLTHYQENVFFHEVNTEEYPLFDYTPYDTTLTSKLVDVVKYEKLDLLHVHYAIPHATVAYLAKQILADEGIYIPVVTTLHGTDITLVGSDRSFAPVVAFSINQSDGVTAVSNHLRHQTCEQLKIKKEIEVIYNFIDFARFSRLNKEHFRKAIAPDGEKILVHISNFRKVKRIEDAIKTFEIVQKKVPSKLLLVGDGPERPRLERMTRELGLYEHVRFLGKQDAVEEILAVADLFLIPSSNESFGLAALEAMACEVPVISSNAGGLPEVNIHGVTGCVADVGDYEAMAAHALMLLEDESLLKQYSHNALMQARKFDISIVLPQYEAYYEKVVSRFMASGKKNKLSLTA